MLKKSSFRRYEAMSIKISNCLDEHINISNLTNIYINCYTAMMTKTVTIRWNYRKNMPATSWNNQ